MRILFFSVIFLALSGCASAPRKQYTDFWVKEGIIYENAVTIESDCRHDAVSKVVASSQELNMASVEEKLVDSCMKAQGFRWGKYEKE